MGFDPYMGGYSEQQRRSGSSYQSSTWNEYLRAKEEQLKRYSLVLAEEKETWVLNSLAKFLSIEQLKLAFKDKQMLNAVIEKEHFSFREVPSRNLTVLLKDNKPVNYFTYKQQ